MYLLVSYIITRVFSSALRLHGSVYTALYHRAHWMVEHVATYVIDMWL